MRKKWIILYKHWGEEIMKYNYEEELNEYIKRNGAKSAVNIGQSFLKWVLLRLFNKSENEIDENDLENGVLNCDGANDGGIDCAYIECDTLYIIQCKYRATHKYDYVYTFIEQMKTFFLQIILEV